MQLGLTIPLQKHLKLKELNYGDPIKSLDVMNGYEESLKYMKIFKEHHRRRIDYE